MCINLLGCLAVNVFEWHVSFALCYVFIEECSFLNDDIAIVHKQFEPSQLSDMSNA